MSWYSGAFWGGDAEGWSSVAAAPSSGPAWNTTPAIGSATFTNSNRTAEFTTAETIVRAANALTGKKVFAITIDNNVNFNAYGIYCPRATPVNGLVRDDQVSCGCFNNSTTNGFSGGANGFISGENDTGDTIGFVIDQPNSRFWVTPDGSTFRGITGSSDLSLSQVEAGTSPSVIATNFAATNVAGIYAAVGNAYGSSGGKITLLTAWPWTMPSGYSYIS